jgi:hypothetical protein
MQRFKLLLTTEELKTLQCSLEDLLSSPSAHRTKNSIKDPFKHERDILTKIIVTQVASEEADHTPPPRTEADLAF